MKRSRLNVILLIGVGVLAAVGWWTREQETPEVPLTALQRDAITIVRIDHPEQAEIVLQRADHGWQLTSPVSVAADALEVSAVLKLAETPVRRQVQGADLAALGLDVPAFTVTLDQTRLAFGDTEPISAQRFVAVDARLALIDNPPSAALDADYSDLVTKALVPGHEQLAAIVLPDNTRVERDDRGWRVVGDPERDPAALAEGWTTARAMWNAATSEAIDLRTLDVVTLVFESGAQRRYAVARRAPQFELINLDAGVQHTISAALAGTLLDLPPPDAPPATTD